MANDLSFNQLSTVLNNIVSQATGESTIKPVDATTFINVAQTGLKAGYDPLLNAISQVLTKTIFRGRPYSRKFATLKVDEQRYGNHTRKINICDSDFEDDYRIKLVDGEAVDMYEVKKPNVLQTNFYGEQVYEKSITVFRDQLDVAFSGAEEFGRFIAMIMQNVTNQIEQAHETTARATVANFIAGKVAGDTTNVLHLVTEYNTLNGTTYDADTIKVAENFIPFAKWLFGRITTISSMMTERSQKFHVNITGKEISRHTPAQNQKMMLYAPEVNNIKTSVLSDVYNQTMLSFGNYEEVNFWQNINSPSRISYKPVYTGTDGDVVNATTEVEVDNILGIIYDEEAMGYTSVNQWSMTTPFNAKGGYTNMFWHFTEKFWNDNTENAVVLLLD